LLRLFASAAARANAQVRDAVYRGTMVCDKLPFTAGKSHEAIEVTVAGVTVCYSRVVRLRAVDGQACRAHGRGNRQYEAKYAGTFLRRLTRPLRVFLPRDRKQP